MPLTPTPHWEHGYRCHGYWLGGVRVGWIGLPNFRSHSLAEDGYSWVLDMGSAADFASGRAKSLRTAKRLVEKSYRVWIATHGEFKPTPKCW